MNDNPQKYQACREKYWTELNDSEKIERMRTEVKRIQYLQKKLDSAVYLLLRHEHNQSGKLVTELRDTQATEDSPIRLRNEEYF